MKFEKCVAAQFCWWKCDAFDELFENFFGDMLIIYDEIVDEHSENCYSFRSVWGPLGYVLESSLVLKKISRPFNDHDSSHGHFRLARAIVIHIHSRQSRLDRWHDREAWSFPHRWSVLVLNVNALRLGRIIFIFTIFIFNHDRGFRDLCIGRSSFRRCSQL